MKRAVVVLGLLSVLALSPARAFALPTRNGIAVDTTGNLWLAQTSLNDVVYFSASSGCAYRVGLPFRPVELVATADGAVWVLGNGRDLVARMVPGGDVTYTALPKGFTIANMVAADAGSVWIVPSFGTEVIRVGIHGLEDEIRYSNATRRVNAIASGDGGLFVAFDHVLRTYKGVAGAFTDQSFDGYIYSMSFSDHTLWAIAGEPFALAKLKDGRWQRYGVPGLAEGQSHSFTNVALANNIVYFAIDQNVYRASGGVIQHVTSNAGYIFAIAALSNDHVLGTTDTGYIELSSQKASAVDVVKRVELSVYPCNSSVLPSVFPSAPQI
jgi:hypothetical protein